MNILYYGLGTNQGGIETYLYKIAKNIDHDTFGLFYIDETGGNACFRQELEELGAVFFNITPRRKSILKNRRDLKQLFDKNKIDVLHFNCNTLSYIEPVVVALEHGIKVVLHSRNSGTVLFSAILHKINYYRLLFNKNRHLISRVAVSDLAGQWMFGNGVKYQVLNNGVEIDQFRFSKQDRDETRGALEIKDRHVYGNVGAFLEAKNHVFILDVFKEIAKKDEKAILLLVGDGPLRERIEKKIKDIRLQDRIKVLGIRKDISKIMMSMDCLIFPSLYEGFPNVILEAETTGLPIVMSDLITKDVVILENCKQISLEKTPLEWSEECIKVIKNSNNRTLAAKAVENAGFSIREEIKKIQKLYEME